MARTTSTEKLIYAVILGIVLSIVGAPFVGNNFRYSDGFRVGTISKFSHKGIIFKTWEGQLALSGFTGYSTNTKNNLPSNIWEFTVESQEVREQLLKAAELESRVKLTYTQYLCVWPWRGDTDYMIDKVEFLDQKK